ncbi:MAG: hypothetical protein JJU02_12925 [Cryomorphaceae bacterium]|nr:hypothetical protein [Cryomorphaceae bacterium]
MDRFILTLVVGLFAVAGFGQNRTQIKLNNSDNSAVHQRIVRDVSALLTACNVASVQNKAIDWTGIQIGNNAKSRINDIWSTSPFRCIETNLDVNLLRIPGGKFQLRQIPVVVITGDARKNEELVFNIRPDGSIEDLYFGLDQHRYRHLLSAGEGLTDFRRRQMILDFLENFRTAYNRKDLNMLEMTFSENALIIVGRVVQETERGVDGMASLGQQKVELIRYNKQQYMENLRRVFSRNAFIDVNFDDIEIVKHGSRDEIYGVNLRQKWRSSTYGDEGYLFLMIDFEDEEHPLIHVRAWQPEKETPMEEVIELGDFDIIK